MLHDSSDRTLFGLLCDSDATSEAAATELFSRYFKRIRQIIRSNLNGGLNSRVEIADVEQSVWRTLIRCKDEIEIQESLFPVLALIAKRKVAKQYARNFAQKRDLRRETYSMSDLGQLFAVEENIEREATAVQEIIEALPEDLREIAILRMGGHTNDEISEISGLSVRSVYRKIDILRTRLVKELNG